jgi:hypothetical protein
MTFEDRYDLDFLARNQRFYASTLFILQACAACETFRKTKLDWQLLKNPKLMNALRNELNISIPAVVAAENLETVLAILRDQAISLVVKGELWQAKLRRFCKMSGVAVPTGSTIQKIDKLFSLRNQLLHSEDPQKLNLLVKPDSSLSVYHEALEKLLEFADEIKEHLFSIDQGV